jgi:hypothetical protein
MSVGNRIRIIARRVAIRTPATHEEAEAIVRKVIADLAPPLPPPSGRVIEGLAVARIQARVQAGKWPETGATK